MRVSRFWRQAFNPRRMTAALALAAFGVASVAEARTAPPPAQSLRGEASIIDGDTLRIGQTSVRLWGIDAPESGQACQNAEPGPAASMALAAMIAGRSIICTRKDVDRYKRIVATCSVDGDDIERRMVHSGWAFDYPRYSKGAYSDAEATASRKGLGVHSMHCMKPWDWRKARQR